LQLELNCCYYVSIIMKNVPRLTSSQQVTPMHTFKMPWAHISYSNETEQAKKEKSQDALSSECA